MWTQVTPVFLWAQVAPNIMVFAEFQLGSWKYQAVVDTNDGLGLLIMSEFTDNDNTMKILSVEEAKARLIAS